MDAHRHDSPASPHCLGVGRRHSPWTASRQRKKNRQEDEHLPVCISEDEEAQEASTMSKSCEDMIVDMQNMGWAMPATDAGPSARPDAQYADDTKRKPFLFMPSILQGALSPGIQQSSASCGTSISFADIGGCLRTASASILPCSRPAGSWLKLSEGRQAPAEGCSVSPRRNSTGLISWRDQNNDTAAGSFLASLSPVALSTDHASCTTAAAATVRSGQTSGSEDQDQQRKSMKRRSLERTDATLSQALRRSSGMDTVRGAVKELLPPVANSPAVRPRRRASVSKNSTSYLGRSGDQAPQKDQRLHSKSLPFPLEFEFQGAAPFNTGVHGEGFTPVSSSYEDTMHPFRVFGLPESLDVPSRTALHSSVADLLSCTVTPVPRAEEAEGFRILTVLTGNDVDLAGSSDKLARRDQHLRAASAGVVAAAAAQPPRAPAQLPASPAASSPLLQRSSWSGSDQDFDCEGEDLDECSSSCRDEEELDDEEDAQSSPMEGLAVRLIHTEQDFQTPPQSPQSEGKRTASKTSHLLASCCYLSSGLDTYKRGHRNGGHDAADDEGSYVPIEQIVTLEEFNRHLSKAAQLGNRNRADNLWAELCSKGVRPNVQTLNAFLRCLANSFASPDEAETLAREICKTGRLSPNSVTYNLLAETRFRYEQMGLLC